MAYYQLLRDKSYAYETNGGRLYRVGVYQEEYPDGRSETVTGVTRELTGDDKRQYLKDANEVEKESVPQVALNSFTENVDE